VTEARPAASATARAFAARSHIMASSGSDPSASSSGSASAGLGAGSRSPFARLAELLAGVEPGAAIINLSVGEPQHPVPAFVGPVMAAHIAQFGRYPIAKGIAPFRQAVSDWLVRRFALPRAPDPETEVLVLNGSREGLFLAAIAAARFIGKREAPAILLPNPYYPAYAAGAIAAGCEPVYLPATRASNYLPDLDAIDANVLARAVAFYIASPANPQGAVASRDYFDKLRQLADRHGFLVFSDECYSEIYCDAAPGSMLEAAGGDFANAVVFQSLSKRSNLPGLRVGFVAGDRRFLSAFHELRNIAAPQVPVPNQHVAIAAYGDERHVEDSRVRYRAKFELAGRILGDRFAHRRPAGGFCLWLDVSGCGDDEQAALRLWREGGIRVVPGSYLARTAADGSNPGANHIRVALVHDETTTAEALNRMVSILRAA
jgi:aspartate/methionine/tyrosine aminotransferase